MHDLGVKPGQPRSILRCFIPRIWKMQPLIDFGKDPRFIELRVEEMRLFPGQVHLLSKGRHRIRPEQDLLMIVKKVLRFCIYNTEKRGQDGLLLRNRSRFSCCFSDSASLAVLYLLYIIWIWKNGGRISFPRGNSKRATFKGSSVVRDMIGKVNQSNSSGAKA